MTADTRTRVGEELEQRVLPWWQEHGVDHEYGGVLTGFDNAGRRLTTDKYTWSQGRWAWLCARIATDARAGLLRQDPQEWAGYARSTAEFVARHSVLPGDVTAHLVTRSGEPMRVGEHGEVSVSVLTDLFAALGLAGASGLPDLDAGTAREWQETARRLLVHGTRRLLAHTAPSEPYPVPPGYTDLAGIMLRLHVAAELYRVDGRDDTATIALDAAADLVAGDRPMWRADDWWEFRPDRAEDADTLLGRHRTPGHLLETVWMLSDAAQYVPGIESLVPDWLPDLAHHALALGWDDEHGRRAALRRPGRRPADRPAPRRPVRDAGPGDLGHQAVVGAGGGAAGRRCGWTARTPGPASTSGPRVSPTTPWPRSPTLTAPSGCRCGTGPAVPSTGSSRCP